METEPVDSPVCHMFDQGVARDVAEKLREQGWNSEQVSELRMSRVDDDEILMVCKERHAVLVTFDADFHATMAISGATGPSVIRIRIEGPPASQQCDLIERIAFGYSADLANGALVTVKRRRTTCRRLPI